MKETALHRELLDAFRREGAWMAKWPDSLVHRGKGPMDIDPTGKMRFALPKPCDLVGAGPNGRFLAVEAKLVRTPIFRIDARVRRQLETLRALQKHAAFAGLIVNFRFQRQRPPVRVNRALCFLGLDGEAWGEGRTFVLSLMAPFSVTPAPTAPMPIYVELHRIGGGWTLPPPILDEILE